MHQRLWWAARHWNWDPNGQQGKKSQMNFIHQQELLPSLETTYFILSSKAWRAGIHTLIVNQAPWISYSRKPQGITCPCISLWGNRPVLPVPGLCHSAVIIQQLPHAVMLLMSSCSLSVSLCLTILKKYGKRWDSVCLIQILPQSQPRGQV